MKALKKIVVILAISVSPTVFADDIACREEAEKIGYAGALDVLPSCETEQSAVAGQQENRESSNAAAESAGDRPRLARQGRAARPVVTPQGE